MLQYTLKKKVSISGVALHSGRKVTLFILPAGVDSGIKFVRTDIKGKPFVKASIGNLSDTKRGTNLGLGKAKISTVEHVLSALSGMGITNARIEINGHEPPLLDGSAKPLVRAIKKAGIKKQGKKAKVIKVERSFLIESRDALIAVTPSDRFIATFVIDYPGTFVGSQTYTFDEAKDSYEKEVAPARTYGFMKEVKGLQKLGLIKGATLKNTIAITDKGYSSALRFDDELARHKVLDLIGDLALTGKHVCAYVIGMQSGHGLNVQLAKKLIGLGGKRS